MMLTTRLFVFLLHHLWRVMRWTGLTVYHGISVLYRRRQARLQASDWRPRTVYTGRWQLADDGQFCGRAVVLRLRDVLKPGVELLYFGEETAEPYYSERQFVDDRESVMVAEQMLLRFLGSRHQRQNRRNAPVSVLVTDVVTTAPVNDEAA
ncbi:TPA: hypothetical protein ACJGT9_000763 [Salmonella enterica subsp. enterica serovar Adelaide]|nr:hypothetical protein [Salmonella enterica subsp. enterica serovar Typhimurium]EDL8553049.1 hypothetical protein [Salmonella enterica subsp. enterica serovar Typhimurium]EDL9363559.1 hypothetical protein [Salmonella enterica subsp. enterica serovar Typhimurium]EDM4892661.1 hypothetical protein [Salmonella enterica subsp. enterica serovar Typhimurium]HCS8176853.1 hypothetical protein [Salmonella enterica subsp. enterica serovar Typhimurium]